MIITWASTVLRPLSMIMVAGLTCLLVAPAARAAGGLSLSVDGEHWGSTVDTPLWDPGVRWVPGDSHTVSLWVRNDTGTASTLRVEMVSSAPTGGAGLADRLAATARVDGTETDVDDGLVPVPAPLPRDEQRVDLIMTFPASAGNHTQTDVAATRIRITLTERTGPTDGTGPTDLDDRLPATGGPTPRHLALGAAGVLAGALLLPTRRTSARGSR